MLKHVLMTKEPRLIKVILDQGGAIWLGGLARIDLRSGPSVGVIVFMSNEVSIVRNTSQKANLNYLKGFGTELYPTYSDLPSDTAFVKHEVKIRLQLKHRICEHELAIHGLGSITFRQLENTNIEGKTLELDLYLPANVSYTIRPALLGPKEAATAKPVVRRPRRGNQSGIN
jgi:hypothetical protein